MKKILVFALILSAAFSVSCSKPKEGDLVSLLKDADKVTTDVIDLNDFYSCTISWEYSFLKIWKGNKWRSYDWSGKRLPFDDEKLWPEEKLQSLHLTVDDYFNPNVAYFTLFNDEHTYSGELDLNLREIPSGMEVNFRYNKEEKAYSMWVEETDTTKAQSSRIVDRSYCFNLSEGFAFKPRYETVDGDKVVDLGLSVRWADCEEDDFCYFGTQYYYLTEGKEGRAWADTERPKRWGEAFRRPTAEEMKELLDNCLWTPVTDGETNGKWIVTSLTNGNSIVIINPDREGRTFGLWTSTLNDDGTACCLLLGEKKPRLAAAPVETLLSVFLVVD